MMPTNSEPQRMDLSQEFDIISNLHDSILSKILCFLPTTKEVLATSILSKRWRYVWTSVDKLVFKYPGVIKNRTGKHFAQSVNKILKFHQGNIKDLDLHCSKYTGLEKFDVTSWINTAVARGGVERLRARADSDYKFPNAIFSCKTLVDLSISGFDTETMDIPRNFMPIFPCLKKLHVSYLSPHIEFFDRIVTPGSSLEHLIVHVHHTPVDIVSSSMKRLELHFTRPICLDKKILLGAPSLEYLQIECTLPTDIVVTEQLSALIEADIYLSEIGYGTSVNIKQIRDSFARLILALSNVKVLRLNCHFQKFLNIAGPAKFLNLTKLEIVSPFFEWRLLVSLMEASINLEGIILKKVSIRRKHKLEWIEPKKVPTCLSSSLRKISIDGFGEDELPMVNYVLRNAQILEQMDIRCSSRYRKNNVWKSDMLQKIQKLHRVCPRCEISLVEKIADCSTSAKWECYIQLPNTN